MPFFPPAQPDLNKAPVQGMTPELQAQIQQLMTQNPELYPHSAVGQNIDPAELNAFNRNRAQLAKPQPQGLAGIASDPNAPPPGVDRVQR